jgi:hypothetical protein
MTSALPPKPSVERLKKQAKDLLRAHRAGDTSCCGVLRRLKQFEGRPDKEILAGKVSLLAVQYALAMEYGFEGWGDLTSHVESARPDQGDSARTTRVLPGLEWVPRATSHMGCLEGCAAHLGIDISPGWLYGGTGHAWVLIAGRDLCPSGPHSWGYLDTVPKLGRNVGFRFDVTTAHAEGEELLRRQEAIWHSVRRAIDGGVPCYGWHFEFCVIKGYDDDGYVLSGPVDASGVGAPGNWREFGSSAVGFVEVLAVRSGKAADDRTVVRDALRFATTIAESREGRSEWGVLAAYDNWADGLASGETVSSDGAGYHAAVWAECRTFAVEFLKEAKTRLRRCKDQFDRAISHYGQARDALREVSRLFPPCLGAAAPVDLSRSEARRRKAHTHDQARRDQAADFVREAKAAEHRGVAELRNILAAIG